MGLLNTVLILAAVLALSIYFEQRDKTPEISPADELNKQLIEAAKVGNLLEMKRLVAQARGADIHTNFDASLLYAAYNGHLNIMRYLVEHGANIHAQDDRALLYAAYNGHLEVVKFLIGRGAPVEAAKDWGTEEVQDFFNTWKPKRGAGGKLKLSKPRKSKSATFKI